MNYRVLSLLFLGAVCALGEKVPKFKSVFPGILKEGRITYARVAHKGQFPWQVSVSYDSNEGTYACGGSLISSRWVLTVAHCCVPSGYLFTIILGSTTINNKLDIDRVIVRTTKSVIHRWYNEVNLNHDIALIDLGKDIGPNDYIKPIRLPSKGEIVRKNQELEVCGWGSTINGGPMSIHLLYAKQRSISNSRCAAFYIAGTVKSTTLCTRGIGAESTCDGDSGSGLVDRQHKEATLVGVVSFITDGCPPRIPTGYVRTEPYLDWISRHTGILLK